MKEILKYKNFYGSVEVGVVDEVIYGMLLGIRHMITYESLTISTIKDAFIDAVEDYIEFCEDKNIKPQISNLSNLEIYKIIDCE